MKIRTKEDAAYFLAGYSAGYDVGDVRSFCVGAYSGMVLAIMAPDFVADLLALLNNNKAPDAESVALLNSFLENVKIEQDETTWMG